MAHTALVTAPIVLSPSDVPVTDHRFGINSVIDFKGPADGRWGMGVEFESICYGLVDQNLPVACAPGGAGRINAPYGGPEFSTFEARDLVLGRRCSLLSRSDNHERALRLFNLAEQTSLEAMLFDLAISDPGATDAGIDAVPGTSGTVQFDDYHKALGHLLNRWYVNNPQVAPTLFMTPDVAINLGDVIERHGNHLELVTGEKVAVAPGMLWGSRENRAKVHESPAGPILIAVAAPFGFKGARHVFDVDNTSANESDTYAHATYLIGYHCSPEYVQFSSRAVGSAPPALISLIGGYDTRSVNAADPAEYAALSVLPGASLADQLAVLNAHPAVGTSGTSKPTAAWEAGRSVSVYFYDGNRNTNMVVHWDGTKWVSGLAPKKVLAPGATFTDPLLTSFDIRAAGGMFTANPTTAWTAGQKATVRGVAIHWTGTAWAAGAAT